MVSIDGIIDFGKIITLTNDLVNLLREEQDNGTSYFATGGRRFNPLSPAEERPAAACVENQYE